VLTYYLTSGFAGIGQNMVISPIAETLWKTAKLHCLHQHHVRRSTWTKWA